MKYIGIFANRFFLLTIGCLWLYPLVFAQQRQITVGKKIQVQVTSTNQSNSGLQDEQLSATTSYNLWQDYEVQSVTPEGYTLKYNLKRVNGSVEALGDKHSYDSDDPKTQSMKEMAPILQLINHPQLVQIQKNKSNKINSLQPSIPSSLAAMNNADADKLFLSLPNANLKLGYSWTDSVVTEDGKMRNDYFIIDTSHQQITISLIADVNFIGNMQQAGNEIAINMKSFTRATRVYNRITGWLIKETAENETVGSTSSVGRNNIPLMMKVSLVTTVL